MNARGLLQWTGLVIALIGIERVAGAHDGHRHPDRGEWPDSRVCVVPASHTELTSVRVIEFRGECQEVPLMLTRVTRAYPAMGGAVFTVNAWAGGYSRLALVEKTYRTTVYSCYGGPYVYEHREGPLEEAISFSVENPNLRDSVSASFEANAPLTDAEAQAALIPARAACEAVISPIRDASAR